MKQGFWEAGLCFCLGASGTLLSLLSTQHTTAPLVPSPTDSQTHEVPQNPESLLYSQGLPHEESARYIVPSWLLISGEIKSCVLNRLPPWVQLAVFRILAFHWKSLVTQVVIDSSHCAAFRKQIFLPVLDYQYSRQNGQPRWSVKLLPACCCNLHRHLALWCLYTPLWGHFERHSFLPN